MVSSKSSTCSSGSSWSATALAPSIDAALAPRPRTTALGEIDTKSSVHCEISASKVARQHRVDVMLIERLDGAEIHVEDRVNRTCRRRPRSGPVAGDRSVCTTAPWTASVSFLAACAIRDEAPPVGRPAPLRARVPGWRRARPRSAARPRRGTWSRRAPPPRRETPGERGRARPRRQAR